MSMKPPPLLADRFRPILVVDDSPSDSQIARRALARAQLANPVIALSGAGELLEWLECRRGRAGFDAEMPAAVLMDLRMPGLDGLEALRRIRANPETRTLPIVMLSGSLSAEDMVASYACGANSYVVKAAELDRFARDMEVLGRYWSTVNQPPHPPR
jgi:CheY-like chemotaxis protein